MKDVVTQAERNVSMQVKNFEDIVMSQQINNDNDLEYCAKTLSKGSLSLEKEIRAYFEKMKKPSFAAHKAICSLENSAIGKIKDAVKVMQDKIAGYISAHPESIKLIKTRKDYKITSIDPNKLERKFMMPNEKAIRDTIKATSGLMKIKGVEFEEVTTIIR